MRAAARMATFSAILLSVFCLTGRAVAQSQPTAQAEQGHDFTIWEGEFALCAASTCKPTGGTITVNVTGGGTATFPEVNCTCPIFDGPNIADLKGGNMQGSCTPPNGQIWSTYQPRATIPQAITNWSRLPSKSHAPPQICGADLNLGNQLSNCFSFACDPAREIHGVPVATCHCPLGESLNGTPVAANTAFATQAGQGNQEICSEHPVSGPLPTPK
jgi:hypothetical protein